VLDERDDEQLADVRRLQARRERRTSSRGSYELVDGLVSIVDDVDLPGERQPVKWLNGPFSLRRERAVPDPASGVTELAGAGTRRLPQRKVGDRDQYPNEMSVMSAL
jgi:hypothetical protein